MILTTITVLAISGAFVQLARYIAAKLAGTKYSIAADAVVKAVEFVNQTFVDDLKQAGSFDKTAQIEAMERAILAAVNLMGESVEKYIMKTFGSVEDWIATTAEAYIAESKK